MKKMCVLLVATFAATTCSSQTFDIAGYCGEMARRQGFDVFWRERCVSVLEVQRKYLEKYREDQASRSRVDRMIAQGEWFIEMMKLGKLVEEASPTEAPLLAARVDQLMAQCRPLLAKSSDCDDMQREIDGRRRK